MDVENVELECLVNKIHARDCLKFMKRLPEKSIDLCMTSPPYWQMRDYWSPGQLGQENTPEEYIENLVVTFRELKRILKDTGSLYLNLGDVYIKADGKREKFWQKPKQLALIPSRVAAALQEDGWILRNDVCWHKTNGLPSSVKDRLTNRWEHIFHFVKQRKYYYNLDAIREPLKESTIRRVKNRIKLQDKTGKPITQKSKYFNRSGKQYGFSGFLSGRSLGYMLGGKGKNPGDVWQIPIKPFSGLHFAVYPEELCVKPILSSCPPEGIVFDPFAGSGTTLVVAKKLGRHFIGCDLNPAYVKLAKQRLKEIKQY